MFGKSRSRPFAAKRPDRAENRHHRNTQKRLTRREVFTRRRKNAMTVALTRAKPVNSRRRARRSSSTHCETRTLERQSRHVETGYLDAALSDPRNAEQPRRRAARRRRLRVIRGRRARLIPSRSLRRFRGDATTSGGFTDKSAGSGKASRNTPAKAPPSAAVPSRPGARSAGAGKTARPRRRHPSAWRHG